MDNGPSDYRAFDAKLTTAQLISKQVETPSNYHRNMTMQLLELCYQITEFINYYAGWQRFHDIQSKYFH